MMLRACGLVSLLIAVLVGGYIATGRHNRNYGPPGLLKGFLLENSGDTKTAEEVAKAMGADMLYSGKTVLITGANSGIGKETARVMALNGADVIMACRSGERCDEAVGELHAQHHDLKLRPIELDLANLKSVHAAATQIIDSEKPLHYLILNAGVMNLPAYTESADGIEMQFAVNHVGHFLLTTLLLDRLAESAPSRIVSLTSVAHKLMGKEQFDALAAAGRVPLRREGYFGGAAYGLSKAANILFTSALRQRLEGSGVDAAAVHPGIVGTALVRYDPMSRLLYTWGFPALGAAMGRDVMKSVPQGAATTIYCTLADLSGSLYYADAAPAPEPARFYAELGADVGAAERLWAISEALVEAALPVGALPTATIH